MPKFIFTQPEFNHQFLELPDGTFSVGRSRRNQIILEEASVSAEHAELLVYGNEIIVRERGSQNGTFVNGVRIEAQSGVRHGQTIRFGRVELLLELGPPEFEESTNITAVAYLAKMRAGGTGASRTANQFPVRFIPQEAADHGASTLASPLSEPALPPPPAHSQNPPTSTLNGSLRMWVWWIIGAAVLLMVVSWFLKR